MAELDIRNGDVEAITQIVFAEYNGVKETVALDGSDAVHITDVSGHNICIYKEDIPNLIKALQKAQELWGNT